MPAGSHDRGAAEFELVRDAVSALRQLRGEYNITPGKQLSAIVVPAPNARAVFAAEAALIGRLTKCTRDARGRRTDRRSGGAPGAAPTAPR